MVDEEDLTPRDREAHTETPSRDFGVPNSASFVSSFVLFVPWVIELLRSYVH